MLSPEDRDQVCATVETLRGELDDLVVRGLRAAGPEDLRTLDAMRAELERVGATHLAERAATLVEAIRADRDDGPTALMRAHTSLRVFERVLTLEHVADVLDAAAALPPEEAEPEPEPEPKKKGKAKAQKKTPPPAKKPLIIKSAPQPGRPPPPPLTLDEGKKLLPTFEDLGGALDGLLSTGLTTATAATRQKLDVTMKEALRMRLARLGAALRFVNEEIGRYLAEDAAFSGRRLAFFLNRAWLVTRGLERAIRAGDATALGRLLLQPATVPLARVELASLGAGKRVVTSTSSCAFEFRLRVLDAAAPLAADARLVWSCLFAYNASFPPEAFLHLPQPQRFLPTIFAEPAAIVVERAAVALDEHGGGRLLLQPDSTVTTIPAEDRPVPWERFRQFSPAAAAARLRAHRPGPLDIEVELQEEVVLERWEVGEPAPRAGRADQLVYPVRAGGLELDAVVSAAADGAHLRAALDGFRDPEVRRPPLFGLVHYELCRFILQPLSVLEAAGPRHLMLSGDHAFDPQTLADLTRALMNRR